MEPIKKTVVFDRIRNYNDNRMPSYDDGDLLEATTDEYTSWGHFPVDLVFKRNNNITPFNNIINDGRGLDYESLIDLSDTLPLVYCGFNEDDSGDTKCNENLVLRYKVMEDRFYLLRKYIEEMRFYKFCRKKEKYHWVEIADVDNFDFYFNHPSGCTTVLTSLPSVASLDYCTLGQFKPIENGSGVTYGDIHVVVNKDGSFVGENYGFECWNGNGWCKIIAVSALRDEIWKIFKVDDRNYEEEFYYFADFFLNKDDILIDNMRSVSSIPYINMPLYMEGEASAMGLLLPYIEEWIPGKKYYAGNTVRYKLSGDTDESAFILYWPPYTEYIEVSESVYNACKNAAHNDTEVKIEVVNGIPHFYRKAMYYNGKYDSEKKVTYFDEFYETSGRPKHWIKASELNGSEDDELPPSGVTGYSKSRINEILRYRKSFEENGGELPFVATDGTQFSELRYCLGSTKVKYHADGQLYTNILETLKFSHTGKPKYDEIQEVTEVATIPGDEEILGFTNKDEAFFYLDNENNVINFYFSSYYADTQRHFFKIENDGFTNENLRFGDGLKLNNNGVVATTRRTDWDKHKGLKSFVNFDLIFDIQDEYIYFSIQFDSDGYVKECSIDHDFIYGHNNVFTAICNGASAITTNTNTKYYSNIANNNLIGFEYSIDRIINTNDDSSVKNTGIDFIEWHPYTISQYLGNYDGQYSWLEVNDTDDISSFARIDTDTMPKITQASVNVIYHYTGDTVTKKTTGGQDVYLFRKDHYYRKISLFYYIKIDYDKSFIYNGDEGFIELENGMAAVHYEPHMIYSTFQEIDGYVDESILGVTDIKAEVDGYIDRNPNGVSSFERHHILSEVNTFADLENYKNNFFKL